MSRLKAYDMKQEPEVGTDEYKIDQIYSALWGFLDERDDFQKMLAFPDLETPEEFLSFLYQILQVKKGITPEIFDLDIEK